MRHTCYLSSSLVRFKSTSQSDMRRPMMLGIHVGIWSPVICLNAHLGGIFKMHMLRADALVEVASQMKALEARVTALASPHSSPASASSPATVTAARAVAGGRPDPPADGRLAHRQERDPQAGGSRGGGTPSTALGGVPGQHAEQQQGMVSSTASDVQGVASSREGAPPAGPSRGVPDLMTFSPAVNGRPPAPNHQSETRSLLATAAAAAASHQADPVQQQHGQSGSDALTHRLLDDSATAAVESQHSGSSGGANTTGNALHAQPGLDSQPGSRPASPMPGISFYDNAVFGSPTPTPSPQSRLHDPSQSLLSPGSSPRPHPPHPQEHQPDLLLSSSIHPEASPQAGTYGMSLHHNQIWSHKAASISIPTTAAAAGGVSGQHDISGAHAAGGFQSAPPSALVPLPTLSGGSLRGAQQGSGIQPISASGNMTTG